MVLAGEQVAERFQAPRLRSAPTIPPTARPREPGVRRRRGRLRPEGPARARSGPWRSSADRRVKLRTVAASLRSCHSRASARRRIMRHARPVRVIGNERRVTAETRVGFRMAQDEPFDELPRRRVADRFLDVGRFAGLGLARKIDRLLDRGKIAGERRSFRFRRGCLGGTLRLAPLRRCMRRMPVFPESSGVPARLMRLLGMVCLLVAVGGRRVARQCGGDGQGEEAGEPDALDHCSSPPANPHRHERINRTTRPVSRVKTNTARIRNCHASATSQRKRG